MRAGSKDYQEGRHRCLRLDQNIMKIQGYHNNDNLIFILSAIIFLEITSASFLFSK
jgi:hypothetical protein